ncbi:MAG: hypothetical protein PHD67_01375 [Oscillospiraceae bacterium]|nr:hypothetical protein [Oscillospiraceae bacterium]
MKCPVCDLEGTICRCRTEVEGDDSPAAATRVFTVQDVSCRNPQCEQYGKVVHTLRHLIYAKQGGGESADGSDVQG